MRIHPLLALALSASVVPNAEATAAAAAATVAAVSTSDPPSSLLTVHEDFLSSEEITSLLVDAGEMDPHSSGTFYGPAVLPPSIARRLRDLAGTGTCSDDYEGDDGAGAGSGVAVMTMLMEETTDLHRDCHVPQSEGRVVEDDVAFVFLSSSPRSAFVHGGIDIDDDFDNADGVASAASRVKVEAGTLVRFRGSVPHRTVVPPGSAPVRIAGPFHLKTLAYVGSCQAPCETASDCKGGAFFASCECADGSIAPYSRREMSEREMHLLRERELLLLREGAKERAMGRLADLEAELKDLEAEESARKGFLRHVVNKNKDQDQDQEQEGRELQSCFGTCKEATGACIFDGGACLDGMTPYQCGPAYGANGGVFQGGPSTCDNHAGIPDIGGMCCFKGRHSFRSNPLYCEVMTPGFYAGNGTSSQADCPEDEEFGACCFMNGCQLVPSSTCSARGGVFKGDGTSCELNCAGACCGGSDGCKIVTETGANASSSTCDGTFQGPGTDCYFEGCPARCQSAFQTATDIMLPPEGQVTLYPGDTSGSDNYKDTFPVCDDPILTAGGAWYNLEVPGGRRVTVSTCSGDMTGAFAGYDTSLSIYTGSDDCSDVECAEDSQEIDGSGDSPNCNVTKGSTYSWCNTEGSPVTYRIMVHGYSSGSCAFAEGRFSLGIRDEGTCANVTTTTTTASTATPTTTTTSAAPGATTTTTPTTTTTTPTTTTPTTTTTTTTPTTTTTSTTTSTSTTTTTTASPTGSPTNEPTSNPTSAPTSSPTSAPTDAPTSSPTNTPTNAPTCPDNPLRDASDYNIFIRENFDPTAADACKAVAVGGDATLPTGWSAGLSQGNEEFPGPETSHSCSNEQTLRLTFYADGNVAIPSSGSVVGGIVAGSIDGDSSPGEKTSPSTTTPFSVTDCAVVLSDPAQADLAPYLPDIDRTFVELEALAQELKGATDEPPVSIEAGGILTLDASGQGCGHKAWNVGIKDVADIGYSVQIRMIGSSSSCPDDTYLINWLGSGTEDGEQLSASYYLTDVDETRIFNNFPDAEAIVLSAVDWRGAFLAPKAHIWAMSGAVWSQIVARSWTGDAEIECGDFLGNFCPP